MLKELDAYDWEAAFSFCSDMNDGSASSCGKPEWAEGSGKTGTSDVFNRGDVAEVIALAEGENDGNQWLAFGRLTDDRYFFLSAGCDYTGWDCIGTYGRCFVAMTRAPLESMQMTHEERSRLGLSLPSEGKAQP
jgi:hypothetical protein